MHLMPILTLPSRTIGVKRNGKTIEKSMYNCYRYNQHKGTIKKQANKNVKNGVFIA